MDQIKTGKFIAEMRKEQNLTQRQLADALLISDKTVSKWECGRALPDSSVMLDLCEILGITVNDLLNGEIIDMIERDEKMEKALLEAIKEKEETDKKLFTVEIVLGVISTVVLLGACLLAAFVATETWMRILILVLGAVSSVVGFFCCIWIEQRAGFYECKHCKNKYVPGFFNVTMAMHMGRTRYLKCPKCNKWSWNKKVLSKREK